MVKRLLYVSVFLFALGVVKAEPSLRKFDVLILHSYHIGYKWTDSITEGLVAALDVHPGIYITYEYMDTKRHTDQAYLTHLTQLYQSKYNNKHFDVVIACDNNAFEFAKQYGSEVFGQTPVVFCGVNYFEQDEIESHPNFTGVNEAPDLEATLTLMLKLHPETKDIVAITDTTTTGSRIRNELEHIIDSNDYPTKISILDDVSMAELEKKVAQLSDGSLILYTFFFKDSNGDFYEYDEAANRVYRNAAVPIYGTWDFALGYGIVGGYLTSGYTQGYEAGRLALKILEGTPPQDIPVIMSSPNRYMFDYNQLKRFLIHLDQLPANSIIMNTPFSFFRYYKKFIFSTIVILLILLLIIFILSYLVHSLQRVQHQLTLSNQKLTVEIRQKQEAQRDREELLRVLSAKNKELESIIHVSYHDLQSPLVNIQGFSQELGMLCQRLIETVQTEQFSDEKQRIITILLDCEIPSSLNFITNNCRKIDRLQAGLRELCQLDHKPLTIEQLNMNSLLQTLTDSMQHQLNKVNGKLTLDNVPDCCSDRQAILQVFRILLDNAIKFRHPERPLHIQIWAEPQGGLSTYYVYDNGIGIMPQHHDKIFEIFHKLNPSSEGDGVGLTIAQRMISRLHGYICIESELDKGALFIVSLPTQKFKCSEEILHDLLLSQ